MDATDGAARPGDRGNGVVAGCIGPSGQLLYLGTAHPTHGFLELTAAPVFDERARFDPDAVRAYRDQLTDERYAVLELSGPDGAVAGAMSWAEPGEPAVRLRWQLAGPTTGRLRFGGRLQAPTLAEITEAGVQRLVPATTVLRVHGGDLVVEAPGLPAAAVVTTSISSGRIGSWAIDGTTATASIQCGGPAIVDVGCSLAPARSAPDVLTPARRLIVPDLLRGELFRLRDAALRYITECSALRVDETSVCLLADHRLLPLGWIRDAYYQTGLLLSAGAVPLVAAHLRWVWTTAERPEHRWVRSYLPNGRAKDVRFQADQQLYPLLELADYARAAGTLPDVRGSWDDLVRAAWHAVPVRDGLMPTEENAADDLQSLPYLVAVQLLRAHTAARMAELGATGAIDTGIDFVGAAAESRDALARFVTDGPAGPMWAYAIDGAGTVQRYQDANDLPTALAPLWGVCAADDPIWQATMRFAFSAENPGYAPGAHGGLGSVHTPGPWTLGDLQEWVWASLCDDWPRAERTLLRLLGAAYPDGMLPEAYDPDTGRPTARPWFAWPGAALGTLLDGVR